MSREAVEMTLTDIAAAVRMDDIYRYQRFIYDVTRRYFLLGRLELIEALAPPPQARVLEVGCGTAWNLVQTARRHPDTRLYGFDISTEMLHTARRSIDRAGLRDRISLDCGDATSFDTQKMFGVRSFDRIVISYALSMIPDWIKVIEAARKVLSHKGEIHVIDFGRSERLPSLFRRVLFAWLAHFGVTPRAHLEARLNGHAREHGLTLELTRKWRGYAVHGILRRT